VEECAAMIGFMASEECSFCSGAVFDLTGGGASY
jgi:2-dehydro-3-deoxy-L-rhamnonate dehydrogenase (NAD+)